MRWTEYWLIPTDGGVRGEHWVFINPMNSKKIILRWACALGFILPSPACLSAQTRATIQDLQKLYDDGNLIKNPHTPDDKRETTVTDLMNKFVPGESAAVRHAVAYGLASVADSDWIPSVALMR